MASDQAPPSVPIGLQLTRVARVVSRAFDEALAEAGGSLPMWLVLLNVKINPRANQRELADAVGVREPTLTQHLNAMERHGLITRRRDPTNRRIHIVEVTGRGEELFLALRDAAVRFDKELRHGLNEAALDGLALTLSRLADNVADRSDGPAWIGLANLPATGRPAQTERPGPNLEPSPEQSP